MSTARLNISLAETLLRELNKEVKPRQRSRFISEAIKELLKKRNDQKLAAEYREAAESSRKINSELEGVLLDGLG